MSEMETEDPCEDSEGDCNKASSLVNKFIDNILDDDEKGFVQRHLSDCPGCSHGFEFESMFHLRMASITPIPMPSEFKENLLLALGFPGMADSMKGSFAALGSPDADINTDILGQMGIPKGEMPKGEIPKSRFFRPKRGLSGTIEPKDD